MASQTGSALPSPDAVVPRLDMLAAAAAEFLRSDVPDEDAGARLVSALADIPVLALDALRSGRIGPGAAAELADRAVAAQTGVRGHMRDARERTVARIHHALAEAGAGAGPDTLVGRVPAALCEACSFDRAVVSAVSGSTWIPLLRYEAAAGRAAASPALGPQIPLTASLPETDVLRRRSSVLVTGVGAGGPFAELPGSRGYVVAALVACDQVIGFLHADAPITRRRLTDRDRVAVQTFAGLFGLMYERAVLAQALECQTQRIRTMFAAAEQVIGPPPPARLTRQEIDRPCSLLPPEPPGGAATGDAAALSPREREILALLATGATNGQIAARLVVSESTVKSHVKRILKKMSAANRAEAVYRYTRLAHTRDAV